MPSHHFFFTSSRGLLRKVRVPKGFVEQSTAHIERVEKELGVEIEEHEGEPRWVLHGLGDNVSDEVFCEVASKHNAWVRRVYKTLTTKPKTAAEFPDWMTVSQASTILRGLHSIDVPVRRWTKDYYRERMDHLYEVMRGREDEGTTFGVKALTEKQANAVIWLFSFYLDKWQLDLEVPRGHDCLLSSYDGGYDRCEKCGPVVYEDWQRCRKRACPLKEEFKEA